MTIGDRIKWLRKRKADENGHCTQEDLGKVMGVSADQIRKWEKNEVCINSEKIVALADYFNVSCDYILRGGSKDHLLLMNKTGLSDGTIHTLEAKKEHNSRISDAIDLLVGDLPLISSIASYFFDDLSRVTIQDKEGNYDIVLAESFSFAESQLDDVPIRDFEATLRVQIMDKLKALREVCRNGKS